MSENVVILGATSRIAAGVAEAELLSGAHVYLVARDQNELRVVASDLEFRTGRAVGVVGFPTLDAAGLDAWSSWLSTLPAVHRCYSLIGSEAPHSGHLADDVREALATNVVVPLRVIEPVLEHMGAGGALVVVSSVAQLVPRPDVAAYGAAKSALSFALQSMMRSERYANRRIIEVRLGWVDTRMSIGRTVPGLTIGPREAGARLAHCARAGAGVRYVPGWWRLLAVLAPPGNAAIALRAAILRRFHRSPGANGVW